LEPPTTRREDVAIASTIPNMSVIAPCDPAEAEAATRWCATQERGPVYLRLGKAGEPDFTSKLPQPWAFGKIRQIRTGADVCILSYGPIMKRAMAIADHLEANGKRVAVHSVATLKPLDREGLTEVLRGYPHVVVIEECAPNGSLSMRVRDLAWTVDASCASTPSPCKTRSSIATVRMTISWTRTDSRSQTSAPALPPTDRHDRDLPE